MTMRSLQYRRGVISGCATSCSGPEIRNFQRAARASDQLATLEAQRSADENDQFVEARRQIQRLMVIAALVAGLFVLILLVTANDLARLAERGVAAEDDGGDKPVGSR